MSTRVRCVPYGVCVCVSAEGDIGHTPAGTAAWQCLALPATDCCKLYSTVRGMRAEPLGWGVRSMHLEFTSHVKIMEEMRQNKAEGARAQKSMLGHLMPAPS